MRGEAIPINVEDDDRAGRQLEQALGALAAADREIVLMRFYEGRSLDRIGASLGITSTAAAKRLSRAVARLRNHVAADEAHLRCMLCAAAPAGLAQRTIGVASGAGGPASVVVDETVKGVIRMMMQIKAKLIAATAAALVLGIGGGVMSVSLLLAQPAPSARGVDAAPAPATAPAPSTAPAPVRDLTPKQVLARFGAAIRAGDGAALRTLIDAEDADTQRLTQIVCDYVQSNAELRRAVAEKFGKPAVQQLAALESMTPVNHLGSVIDGLMDHLEETIDEDVATLRPPDPGIDTFVLVRRDGGGWKLSADRMTAAWSPQDWETREGMIRRAGEGVRALIASVRDGQIANLDELKEELSQLQRNR
jgi:hypothetical protein